MTYKGDYSSDTAYYAGDVVVFTDGIVYCAKENTEAGTTCHDTRRWGRVLGYLADTVIMFHNMFAGIQETMGVVNEVVFDNKTLVLASSTEDSDKVYAITVDDTAGLEANEITDEEAGDA